MNISKKDALQWFEFFAEYAGGEPLPPHQQEIALAVLNQIETAVEDQIDRMMANIPGLKSLQGRTRYVGPEEKFPKGCRSCLLGTGLSAVRKTHKCNLQCPFCYNYGEIDQQPPIGADTWEIGGTKFKPRDLDLLLSTSKRPTGLAYVYLEPFTDIEAHYPVIRRFHEAGVYQHMYTNGTLCTEENLRALRKAGLDELRFNLGASNASDHVIEMMAVAKSHIPMVGIETPMTPEFHAAFLKKKEAIFATGIDFMNCAELHLNPNNIENYWGANMVMYRQGYVSPIWSHELTLDLMTRADSEKWPIVLHDCCNRTKFARDLNLRAHEGGWFGASDYHNEFEGIPYAAFLPVLQDESFRFLSEEPLPEGYRLGEIVL